MFSRGEGGGGGMGRVGWEGGKREMIMRK